ncbi:hypothetical protein [Antarcticimicrobium sediminis]|uniref:Uncharacterized protein n=1 Tax=Antarcticimicrobium sediminis TaxID=2546227 RepID=A0A4R5EKM9_9RHOB|nr:hypothetical protein [Antarcticimicrobium sediminis]TDE35058.1 hypothetical protein E1B25_18015 [Antarcticimicrobium sediminis]
MSKNFGFEIDLHGARVVVEREPLHSACSTDSQIDHDISALKSELDRLAVKMKKAVREQANKPLFDGGRDV